MTLSVGIIAAIIALLAWGFGDFFIQRAIRAIGSYGALFFIGAFGAVFFLPFIWSKVPTLFYPENLLILTITLTITFVGAVILFGALKVGKISVIEPVLSLEVLITLFISLFFLREAISSAQIGLIGLVFIGITMTVIHHEQKFWWQWWKKERWLERGVVLALVGALFSALMNTFTALASRGTSPLETMWFVHTGLAIISLGVLGYRGEIKTTIKAAQRHWQDVFAQSALDNVAWVAFAKAALTLPVGITIGITESYVALAAFLGIQVSKEKLKPRQLWGIVIALAAAITLAVISN